MEKVAPCEMLDGKQACDQTRSDDSFHLRLHSLRDFYEGLFVQFVHASADVHINTI